MNRNKHLIGYALGTVMIAPGIYFLGKGVSQSTIENKNIQRILVTPSCVFLGFGVVLVEEVFDAFIK